MRILGISDDCDTCDCCGRSGLKRTVALDAGQGGPAFHYGVNCAARALGKPAARVERLAEQREAERKQAAWAAAQAAWLAADTTLRTGLGRVIVVRQEGADFVARDEGGNVVYRNEFGKTSYVQRILAAGGAITGGPLPPKEQP